MHCELAKSGGDDAITNNNGWSLGLVDSLVLDLADEPVEVRFLLGALRGVGLVLVLGLLDGQRVGDPAGSGEDVPVVQCQEAMRIGISRRACPSAKTRYCSTRLFRAANSSAP